MISLQHMADIDDERSFHVSTEHIGHGHSDISGYGEWRRFEMRRNPVINNFFSMFYVLTSMLCVVYLIATIMILHVMLEQLHTSTPV